MAGLIVTGMLAVFIIIPIILWKRGIVTLSAWLIAFWTLSAIFCFFTSCLFLDFFYRRMTLKPQGCWV